MGEEERAAAELLQRSSKHFEDKAEKEVAGPSHLVQAERYGREEGGGQGDCGETSSIQEEEEARSR